LASPEIARDNTSVPARFKSFWMGGFECATHINRHRQRLDLIAATQHDIQAEHDYALARSVGIQTVRDGTRWHLIEHQAGRYDFSSLAPMASAAARQRVQVIWDLLHYGWPDDLDIFSARFIDRYVAYAKAVARFLADFTDEPLVFTPINEISFFTWATCAAGVMHPFSKGRDDEFKRQLIRAAIAVTDALWELDPRISFIHGDPLLHVAAESGNHAARRAADAQNASQFEAWDMLAGRVAPELGGHPRYLGTIGLNYYYNNQWLLPEGYLDWETTPPDPRRVPPRELFRQVYQRYGAPLIVGETSHIGAGRARWLRHITEEVRAAIDAGTPIGGVCLYPILDRPDWEDPNHWHNSGMWDAHRDAEGRLRRVPCEPYREELRRAQRQLPEADKA
jgi:hypothetical protein